MFPGQEQSALKSHKKAMHHEIVETPCPECGKVFLSAFKMKYHLSTAHNTATEGKLHLTMAHNLGVWKSYGQRLAQCFSFNFFQTSKKSCLFRNFFVIISDWDCPKCSKSFKFKVKQAVQSKKKHLETHEAHKFVCELCNKSFRRRGSYEAHMNVHSGDLNYKCDDCNKVS